MEFSAENWARLVIALQNLCVSVPSFDKLSPRPKPLQGKRLDRVHLLTAIGSAFSESKPQCAVLPNSGRRLAVASMLHPDSPEEISFDEAWSESIEACFAGVFGSSALQSASDS